MAAAAANEARAGMVKRAERILLVWWGLLDLEEGRLVVWKLRMCCWSLKLLT
jgi:hypothetical protein